MHGSLFLCHFSYPVGECCWCKQIGEYSNSHLVPKSVLAELCKWKADDNRPAQRVYMFRTDIGFAVDAHECTTPEGNIICTDCEELFRHIDLYAHKFWKDKSNMWRSPIFVNGEDTTNVVMFSIVARAMFLYMQQGYSTYSPIFENALQVFREESCSIKTEIEKKEKDGLRYKDAHSMIESTYSKKVTYKDTRLELEKIGFMYQNLTQNEHYRVEFPSLSYVL